jgi:murein DD-endopeptidase MepM/ murein hydrolase activator NlpD
MKRHIDVSIMLLWLVVFFKPLAYAENTVMDVQLPFYDGEIYQCMQNSHDTPSHNVVSTQNDLDFGMKVGTIIVAAADGIMHRATNLGGFGTYAKVDHGNGYWTIYGHLSGYIAQEGEKVFVGQPIAYSGNTGDSTGPHVHFGVHNDIGVGKSQPMRVYGLDKTTDVLGYFNIGLHTDFVCGLGTTGRKYESHSIGKAFSDFSCKALADNQGVLCWRNNPTTCQDGDVHVRYYKDVEGAFRTESGSSVWTWCSKDTGQSKNILSYLQGGYGVGGIGPGTSIEATEPQTPNLPDFIVTKTWLTTLGGTETYQYGLNESFTIKAQSKNIGSGSCSGDIIGHFYLSKGYKEDPHSGDGAWQRVGSSTTHCGNLDPNNTHTETTSMVISTWITVPGMYNIVYCIDHPLDDHNNGGNYPEEHESNNCSTEAVFEAVKAFESSGNFTSPNSLNTQQKAALSAVITKYLLDK